MKLRLFIAISGAALTFLPSAIAQPAVAENVRETQMRVDPLVEYLAGYSAKAPPSADSQQRAASRLQAYAAALGQRDFAAAYAMLRLSYQAANPREHWEMNLKNRGDSWATGKLQILRASWMLDPAGQPRGAYVAYDFAGNRSNGDFDCGYIVLHQPTEKAEFSVVRTEANYVAAEHVVAGKPADEVMAQLPCFLGNLVADKR